MICQNCGYTMEDGLRLCPKCRKPTKNFKKKKIRFSKEKAEKKQSNNKKSDEINQWYIMDWF